MLDVAAALVLFFAGFTVGSISEPIEYMQPRAWTLVTRGPLGAAVDDSVIASIERELKAATGETVYEPEAT